MAHDKRMDVFHQICHERGLKVTHQRLAIYNELIGTNEHLDADSIFRRIKHHYPTISLGTVYKTLETFVTIGVLAPVRTAEDRVRYDSNRACHHHLVCIQCHKIEDFYDSTLDNLQIPKRLTKGYHVFACRVEVEGICCECRAKSV